MISIARALVKALRLESSLGFWGLYILLAISVGYAWH